MHQSKRRRYLVVEKPAEKLHRWRYFKFICVRFYIIRELMNTHLLFRSYVEIEFVERESFPQTKRCRCSSFRIYSLWCHCRLHKDCHRDSCNACGGHGECSPGRVYTVRIRSTESCKTKSLVTWSRSSKVATAATHLRKDSASLSSSPSPSSPRSAGQVS